MKSLEPVRLRGWLMPPLILLLVGPALTAFALGGPPIGLAVGAATVAALLVLAGRARYDEPIEVADSRGNRYRLLAVIVEPLDDPGVAGPVAAVAEAGAARHRREASEVLVLAPALNTRMAHWLSDLGDARFEAQRRLAVSIATLAAAGVEARGRVGDADVVQAVADAVHEFPADEVVFAGGEVPREAVVEVRRRLDRPVRELGVRDQATSSSSLA